MNSSSASAGGFWLKNFGFIPPISTLPSVGWPYSCHGRKQSGMPRSVHQR
jgi:hypothetical protein